MLLVPQLLDLFWSAIEREVEKQGRTATFNRLRSIARRLPLGARRVIFRNVHEQLGGGVRLLATSGAFLPPALQQAWEDIGVIVLQGYGATETGAGCATTMASHPLGCVGWPPKPVGMRIADDGEIQFNGPTLFKGYWENPEATAAAYSEDGWYRTGDLGGLDEKGRLHLHGRKKDIIVLPNGFNVYPGGSRERAPDRRRPQFGGPRDPAGAHRGRGPRARAPHRVRRRIGQPGDRSSSAGRDPPPGRCDGEGGECDAGLAAADLRLEAVARCRLPPDAHVQGEAGPGPGMGGGRGAACG